MCSEEERILNLGFQLEDVSADLGEETSPPPLSLPEKSPRG